MIMVTVMLRLHVAMINLTVMVMVVSVFHFHGTVMVQMSSVTLAGLLTALMELMRVQILVATKMSVQQLK